MTKQAFVFDILFEWLNNTYAEKVQRNPDRYNRWITLRDTSKQMLQVWGYRLKNIHYKPVEITRFSMLLWFHRCPYPIWNILSHLCLALSINTTKKLYASATSIPISMWLNWENYNSIANIRADNMSYMTYNAQVQINSDNTERYLFYNLYNHSNAILVL